MIVVHNYKKKKKRKSEGENKKNKKLTPNYTLFYTGFLQESFLCGKL
jgi:hypothetical protein